MNLLKKSDLKSHDVYEFCYAKDYPNHWSEDSLYIIDEEFAVLVPYLSQVFSDFDYYGREKVTLSEWENVKQLALGEKKQKESILSFFNEIDEWLKKDINRDDYFWIFGL